MESRENFRRVMIVVEGIFHFITILVVTVVGENGRGVDSNAMLTKELDDKSLLQG